jgi:isoleucyl-tRNA synthetase
MVDDLKQGGEELHHRQEPPQSPIAAREEEILEFWNREKIFEKSLTKQAPQGEYIFYDGPPFATGLPHYGHLLQSAIKDAVPRFFTMRGYHVPRRWGWDCHGLPLENQIEQELGLKNKRQIEELGIEKFNKAARDAVLRYADDWKRIIPRVGRWVDMEDDYRTMDASYTESVWWAFKNLYDRGLVYEGFKAMHLCPRCGTTLSNFEVAQGYKDVEDIAVTVKLPLVDEPGSSLLIWTTTPWTLLGNAAAAVKADAVYVKVKVGEEFVIVSEDYFSKKSSDFLASLGQTFSQNNPPPQKILGKELVGKKYEPPFPYFKNELHKHKTHAWRVYAAPYVTLEDGTGIVHLAPAYGAEDLELAQKEKIPLIHHVTDEGRFVATVTDFAGLPVKPKGNPKETDAKVAEWLEQRGKLFKQETIKHSYPHCWRCDTPLLNWAATSWFVNVQKIKAKLLKENGRVRWVPGHVGEGRFNNLLETAPDWAISRSRFWGAPLPVWWHSKTKEVRVVGSVEELLSLVRTSGNRYFIMRHGEAVSNAEGFGDSDGNTRNHLTPRGREEVAASGQELRKEKVDLIITSPSPRARETARIVQQELGLPDQSVMVDERLGEIGFGVYDGRPLTEWIQFFTYFGERFLKAPEGGESYVDLRRRVGECLFETERRYSNKNILFVGHGASTWIMARIAERISNAALSQRESREHSLLNKAQWCELPFTPYPHNENYELDLHRPYIDELPLGDALGGRWQRVKEVFDCWFESGSMPFAQAGYPAHTASFNPKRLFGLAPKGYPADFIAESIDQTRGWFYSLIVLGVALFGRAPYKAVVTNGLVLAEDGRKMSKKLKNYPDPMELVERFGADSLRYYLLSSAVIRGEDLRFAARGVEEVSKKLLMRLDNVRSFYEMYAGKAFSQDLAAPHVLDKWILARLGELVKETTEGFETYELDAATRPLMSFVDDLSTWYLRRSRERFKTDGPDKNAALTTLRQVLKTTAQVMAPTMPFYADYLWREMKSEGEVESVHLSEWPTVGETSKEVLDNMKFVRNFATFGLKQREEAKIKIRQPLSKITIKHDGEPLSQEYKDILADEINVKEVVFVAGAGQEDSGIELDTTLTPELEDEGLVREMARRIQEWRKEQKMHISDRPHFTLKATLNEKRVAEKFRRELIEQTGLASLTIEDAD